MYMTSDLMGEQNAYYTDNSDVEYMTIPNHFLICRNPYHLFQHSVRSFFLELPYKEQSLAILAVLAPFPHQSLAILAILSPFPRHSLAILTLLATFPGHSLAILACSFLFPRHCRHI